jgi:Transposase DDE domain group 1
LLKDSNPELGGFTLQVMRDGRLVTVEVIADGAGLVSHVGSALLGHVADKLGLTRALSHRLAGVKQRRRGHDPGRVLRDLAVMLADGGECVSDLAVVREQQALFGPVASGATAFRMIEKIAGTPGLLDQLRSAHAIARERFWELSGAPQRLTLDVDATLITSHSDKENAAGTYKHGYGFHPLGAYADETREVGGSAMLDLQPADEHVDDPHGNSEQPAGDAERHPGPGHPRPAMIDVRKLSGERSPGNPERQCPGRGVHPAGRRSRLPGLLP